MNTKVIAPKHDLPEQEPMSGRPDIMVTRRMMLVTRRYRKALDQALKDVGHSQVRWEILYALSLNDDDSTLMQVAGKLGLEGPSIVSAMEKLEKEGFIQRRKDPADHRSRLIRLTEEGEKAVIIMQQKSTNEREKLLDGIDFDDLETTLYVLTQMRDNLWKCGIKTG
ncbi:MAG: MarR family transcriptional regulator [Sphingobium sp.]|nr:MarR family transcriptional regulator [Sphingobium sp.]